MSKCHLMTFGHGYDIIWGGHRHFLQLKCPTRLINAHATSEKSPKLAKNGKNLERPISRDRRLQNISFYRGFNPKKPKNQNTGDAYFF